MKMVDATYAPPSKAPEIKEPMPLAALEGATVWELLVGLGAIGLGFYLMRRALRG